MKEGEIEVRKRGGAELTGNANEGLWKPSGESVR